MSGDGIVKDEIVTNDDHMGVIRNKKNEIIVKAEDSKDEPLPHFYMFESDLKIIKAGENNKFEV